MCYHYTHCTIVVVILRMDVYLDDICVCCCQTYLWECNVARFYVATLMKMSAGHMVITVNALYFQAIQEPSYTKTVMTWLLSLAEQSMAGLAIRLLMYAISDC